MRKRFIVLLVLAFAVQPATAWAKGPSGSTETKKRQAKCGQGQGTGAAKVYAGANGVEVCSDDNSAADGRIIVDFEKRYAAADGDPTNGEQGDGFVRLDQSGPSCGTDRKHDASKGPGGSCQP